ncbi:MAG: cysteine desulfurase [Clostridia bacterium]|nr:cysteine desulfurase [Clostridia bacterium]
MERLIYLDNSATTKPCDKSIECMTACLKNAWGNPSSLHRLGLEAEMLLNNARETIAKYIKATPDEIIFTGSGTEANNTAIMSVASKKWGNRVITTEIEHPSVLETVKRLEELGFEVIKLKPNSEGVISLEELKNVLNAKTVLVSIMLVNNEIGSVQPIKEASKLIKELSPKAVFHCDAVQGFGKMPINVKELGVDLLTASGHKVFAPKGIGFLYCKKGVALKPFVTGGGQERGLRSGTESVPLISAFEGAVSSLPDINTALESMSDLNEYARKCFSGGGFIRVNSPENALPYILNISVTGFRSETLLHYLERKNIFVSSGSACAKGEQSYVLKALGLTQKESDSALRISFSHHNTKEDIDALTDALKEATQKLRRSN